MCGLTVHRNSVWIRKTNYTSLFAIYYIPTNCTNLLFIYKQHIKTYVLFKLLKLLLHVSVTDWPSSGRYNISLNFSSIQLLNLIYWCSSMPVVMCVLDPVLSCCCYAVRHSSNKIRQDLTHTLRQACFYINILNLVTEVKRNNVSPWWWSVCDRNM